MSIGFFSPRFLEIFYVESILLWKSLIFAVLALALKCVWNLVQLALRRGRYSDFWPLQKYILLKGQWNHSVLDLYSRVLNLLYIYLYIIQQISTLTSSCKLYKYHINQQTMITSHTNQFNFKVNNKFMYQSVHTLQTIRTYPLICQLSLLFFTRLLIT